MASRSMRGGVTGLRGAGDPQLDGEKGWGDSVLDARGSGDARIREPGCMGDIPGFGFQIGDVGLLR